MNPAHAWFTHDRFGLFVHWGVFSVGARDLFWMSDEKVPAADYEKMARYFEADLYDPAAWARMARQAGMRYAVLITKHHDGFCMWDSDLTDFKITNAAHGKDVTKAFVEAMRAEGIRVGFYYSVIDWHHPDFTIDYRHPLRDADDVEALNAERDMEKYRGYVRGQITELLTRYGQIDYLFYDYSYPERTYRGLPGKGREDWGSEELMELTRQLQPDIIINDRLDIPGDLVTPEQYQPSGPMLRDGEPIMWEACQTLNGSWGYDRDNRDWKSPELLIKMLIDGVSKDGNLILNVGPTSRGEIEPYAVRALGEIGEWMDRHGRSVYGAGASPYAAPSGTRLTQRGDHLFLHLFDWPFKHVHLAGLAGKVERAQLLNDGSEIRFTEADPSQVAQNTKPGGQPPGTVTLTVPVVRPEVAVPVIELRLVNVSTTE